LYHCFDDGILLLNSFFSSEIQMKLRGLKAGTFKNINVNEIINRGIENNKYNRREKEKNEENKYKKDKKNNNNNNKNNNRNKEKNNNNNNNEKRRRKNKNKKTIKLNKITKIEYHPIIKNLLKYNDYINENKKIYLELEKYRNKIKNYQNLIKLKNEDLKIHTLNSFLKESSTERYNLIKRYENYIAYIVFCNLNDMDCDDVSIKNCTHSFRTKGNIYKYCCTDEHSCCLFSDDHLLHCDCRYAIEARDYYYNIKNTNFSDNKRFIE